ncbi:MAG TPA: hypothetical protein VFS41_05110 [Edaphobacter sp.]|nr:hypothetical protein [Edaphobacter sp.]
MFRERLLGSAVVFAPDDGAGAGGGDGGAGGNGGAGTGGEGTGGGGGGGDFLSQLPEDIRGDSSLKDIKDIAGLAKGYVNAQRLIGYDKVAIPKEDSPKEVWDQYYAKIGRPATPEEYKLPKVESKIKIEENDPVIGSFRTKAHELGLNGKQVAGLYQWFIETQNGIHDSNMGNWQKNQEQAAATLKKDWGAAYDQNISLAQQAVEQLGGAPLKELLDSSRLGDHPALIKVFHEVGKLLAEEGRLDGKASLGEAMSPGEAQARIKEKKADPNFLKAYTNPRDPGHQHAVEEMQKLYKFAFPEEQG